MLKLFQNKKPVIILSIVLAVLLAVGAGILVWQLTKDESPDTYTVSFITNGGNEIGSIEVAKGTVLSQADLPVPSKRGEMFLSWYTDEALTAPYWNSAVESDITLYASYVQPADDATTEELVSSIIPFASTDFSVTVRSSEPLTNENIAQYTILAVNYGQRADGEEIKLSVAHEGGDIYRLSGNFASGGEYIIYLISEEIKFNPDDEMLTAYGLTEALRTLQFRIIGENYTEGELSDKVADLPASSVVMNDGNSVTVSGSDLNLIGATEDENGIIKVGEGDDLSNYYKVVSIEATDGNGTTYSVRPAEVDEIYDQLVGYEWKDFDGDELVLNEEIEQQVIDNLANNEQLNSYITYLALASTYTDTYKEMSLEQFGEVVATPLATIVTPAGATVGVDLSAKNENFGNILNEEQQKKFVKLTLGFEYQVRLSKVGSQGTITAQINLQIDFWIYIGVGGYFEIGWGEYDIDAGMTTLTQTEITFAISLMTSDAKKAVNINDEIEAIYNSAKEPTPENLLEQYNELMSGSSKPIEVCDQDIFEMPVLSFLYGAVEISIPVKFVVTLDMEATFTSYFTVLTGCDVGLMGDEDSGLDLYFMRMDPRYKYRIELRGHIEMRVGVEVSLKLSLAYDLASVSLGVQAGFYGELYGYFFYEVDRLSGTGVTNMGGAYYFELGAYVDIRLRAEVCKIKYSGSLWDKKYPFYSAGQKEILYGFVNPVGDVIDLEGLQFVNIEDTGILDVYVYDITEERSEDNPKRVKDYPYNKYKFDISFSGPFYLTNSGYIAVSDPNAGTIFEGTMMISYTGDQLTFRDTLTKYVTLRYSRDENLLWSNVGKTYKIDFTIDGEVIFTREYPYGSTICFEKYQDSNTQYLNTHLDHYVNKNNGILITELRQSEQEALYNAGYAEASWPIMAESETDRLGDVIIVTEDMTIEANSNVKRRPWKVTLVEGDNVTTYEVDHGAPFILPRPKEPEIESPAYSYLFVGWRAEGGDMYSVLNEHVITSDLTLTPYYQSTAKKYNVTFDANGGKIGDGETFTTQYFYGEIPESPAIPVREGTDSVRYEFIGWSPKFTKATEDITYTAQWREVKLYTVTFDAGEGQFDEDGTKTFTITVEDGHALTESDFPTEPYRKVTGGYNDLAAWGVSIGTVVTGNATYTATYKDELISKAFITISDGVNSEDISAYLDGTNKVSGYTYTLNTEYYGNTLVITGAGLTISGNAEDINLTVINTEVTLDGLTLTQNGQVEVLTANGEVVINMKGIVRLLNNTGAEAIRGDSYGEYGADGEYTYYADADITLRGVDDKSWLMAKSEACGISVYGALTIEMLNLNVLMPQITYDSQGTVYSSVAIQVHNHPNGILTVKDSDITVFQSGVVNVAWLDMTNSNLSFSAAEFVPGYASGIDIMNYGVMTEPEALIKLKNSNITFTHDIAIAFAVSFEDGTEYYVNTSLETTEISSAYSSLDALLADISTQGYSGMIDIDSYSSIE